MTETAGQAQVEERPGLGAAVRASVRETGQSLSSVFRNPSLRRVQLALVGSMVGDWAFATAVAVWAYGVGGATAVGVWSAVRLTLMAFTAPIAAGFADRFPRKNVMVVCDVVRGILIGITAVLLFLGSPPAAIFVLATVSGLFGTPFRASQRALLPSLVTRPEELTASNGTSSTIESLSFFLGPAIGATLIGLTDVATVFAFNAATFLWSLFFVLGIRVPPASAPQMAPGEEEPEEEKTSFVSETTAGFRAIFADRDITLLMVMLAAQTVVAGASAVLTVVVAVDVLGTGPRGVGYLDSVLGVGAILGGLVAIARASKRRLGQDMAVGVLLWSLPLLLLAGVPVPVAAFVMMLLIGFGNPLVDVNFDTLIQRITPDEVMGRVFGALEACAIATMALGALLMPLLLGLVGLRWALVVVGLAVGGVALAGLPRVRALDARLGVPDGVPLLRGIDIFAPLDAATIETLARALQRVEVPTGGVVVREGGDSDLFFVIESGEVEVTQDGRVLRQERAGEFFGEIGLVRDVPRTATVTAVTDVVLQALPRREFLDAVTGEGDARRATDDIVSRRLAV